MSNSSHIFQIESIGKDSPLLSGVLLLHAANKNTLGVFPKGAFEEAALHNRLLVAIANGKDCAGYLVYRIAKDRAAITHLTTDNRFRGQGAARKLIDTLKQRTKHLAGISLKCRRDYNISDMWTGFGFTVRQTKEGRGRARALLDCWWYDHGREDLFSIAAGQDGDAQVFLVGMDANIFYDLTCDNRPEGEDTKVLEADWIKDCITLCITQEMYAEIHRGADESKKAKARGAADGFRILKTAEEDIVRLEDALKPLFKNAILDRDRSDMRQVAHAIAADIPFFATRDNPMLSRSDEIFQKYGLRILHPTDLVNHLDSLRREAEYRPSRLEGSRWRERLVTKDDVDEIVKRFKHPHMERANEFAESVRHFLAAFDKWDSRLVLDNTNAPVVYLVQSKDDSDHTTVKMARHSDHPLVPTVLRHIFYGFNREPTHSRSRSISVCESQMSGSLKSALEDVGFFPDGDTWWKLGVVGILLRKELREMVCASKLPAPLKDRMQRADWFQESASAEPARSKLEQAFSPAKVVSPETPCFIVSIRPSWAAHFFDIPVGGQTLMDLKEELHLGIEGVYYCAASNTHLQAPGRILWYVSKGPKQDGPMTIKACSHLAEVVHDTPKRLFGKFGHLGVYSWKDVLETAKHLDHKLTAFRFLRTERFIHEIPASKLSELGIATPINPRRIDDSQFAMLYELGMSLGGK